MTLKKTSLLAGADAHTQRDSTIPIDSGSPDSEEGAISKGHVVFLPAIMTKLLLQLPPEFITSRLTDSLKRIMDGKTDPLGDF